MLGQAFASGRIIGRVNDLVSQLARIPPQSISAIARAHAAQLSSSFVAAPPPLQGRTTARIAKEVAMNFLARSLPRPARPAQKRQIPLGFPATLLNNSASRI
jgi:hypothetical protein